MSHKWPAQCGHRRQNDTKGGQQNSSYFGGRVVVVPFHKGAHTHKNAGVSVRWSAGRLDVLNLDFRDVELGQLGEEVVRVRNVGVRKSFYVQLFLVLKPCILNEVLFSISVELC